MSFDILLIKFVALLSGAIGALARWFSEIMYNGRKFELWHFPMILIVGGFLGYIGGEFATVILKQPELNGFIGGLSGTMGSYGFDYYVKKLSKY